MDDRSAERLAMVETQVAARGVRDRRVLAAMSAVPREVFLPAELAEFAYQDSPLPIAKQQTISQPYIVAMMAEALELRGAEKVLEIGTGSGYAAAILGRLCREVHTVERHEELARTAAERLAQLDVHNVHVTHGDGTLGLAEQAPFDAIVVAAGGQRVPQALVDQLAIGGRLVIPVGDHRGIQQLLRLRRVSAGRIEEEDLGGVRFVPLVGAQGWKPDEHEVARTSAHPTSPRTVAHLMREVVEPIDRIEGGDVGALLDRIGNSRLVLIGEATHGTSEFYRMRAHITRELIVRGGFGFVAVEADWPDAFLVNRYVQGLPDGYPAPGEAFTRFPTWMWKNFEVGAFVKWLKDHNSQHPDAPVGFFGLDLYSLFTSIRAVLDYLDRTDPDAARVARIRYACLSPWEGDPATYGRAALSGRYRVCEREAVAMLKDLAVRRLEYAERDGSRFLDAVQNAKLIANAERYYRAMYYGAAESWNLRDTHMFETLQALLAYHGPEARGIVWEHNSHLGDASATEMTARGELNVGQLCRHAHGDDAYLIGFGTDHGTVAAASSWDRPMEVMSVRPSHPASYERVFHESEVGAFRLALREPARPEVRDELAAPRLERAIGVVYRPDTELQSHYFHAVLPRQFDEYIWFDETRAVTPVSPREARVMPSGHPFRST